MALKRPFGVSNALNTQMSTTSSSNAQLNMLVVASMSQENSALEKEDSNHRSSIQTTEQEPKRVKLTYDDLIQRPVSRLGVCEPLDITYGTEKRPSDDVPRADDESHPTIRTDTPTGIDELVLDPEAVQYCDCTDACGPMELAPLFRALPAEPGLSAQPTFGKTPSASLSEATQPTCLRSSATSTTDQYAAQPIGDQTQSASSVNTTSTSNDDDQSKLHDKATVDTTAVQDVWGDELCCSSHDTPSFLEYSAIVLLRAKAKDVVPVAALDLGSKRFDICNWLHKQCTKRNAPITTAFIAIQLFDCALGSERVIESRLRIAKPAGGVSSGEKDTTCFDALLLVSCLSVALKHEQRECSLVTSDCALLATHHFLNFEKHTFSSSDVIEMELRLLFETEFKVLLTPIAAAQLWSTAIRFDCGIGDPNSEKGVNMQRTLLKLIAMDSIPHNVPAGALGGAAVLAELYRTYPASASDYEQDERVEVLLQKMARIYPRLLRENAIQMARFLL